MSTTMTPILKTTLPITVQPQAVLLLPAMQVFTVPKTVTVKKAINTSIQNAGSTNYNNIANNYNIKFADTLTINKRSLELNTEGSKVYGNANPTTGFTYTTNTGTAGNTTGLMAGQYFITEWQQHYSWRWHHAADWRRRVRYTRNQ